MGSPSACLGGFTRLQDGYLQIEGDLGPRSQQQKHRQPLLLMLICLTSWLTTCALCSDEVQVLKSAPGFYQGTTDADLADLYRDNLDADFAPHLSQQYTLPDLLIFMQKIIGSQKLHRFITLFVIRSNNIYTAQLALRPAALAVKRSGAMKEGLLNATHAGVVFPDTAFLMNMWDESRCLSSRAACNVPLFSLIKTWDWERRRGLESDVLLPFFNHFYQDLIYYPWEKKKRMALMRAAMQNGMSNNCTRMWLVRLGETEEGRKLLDAGITNNLKAGFKTPLVPVVAIPEHARYKYLVTADGFAASCRFGKLLQINSVVLKEESPLIEYYYRSVKPDVHYVPFTKDTALQVLQRLEEGSDAPLQKLVDNAQHFSYRFLSQHAKALYVRQALQRYSVLFDSAASSRTLERFVAQLDLKQELTADSFMEALRRYMP